jgi:hypothetical protein
MEAKKLNMKIPPSALYCPICNEKIDKGINTVQEVSNILKITKCCEECGAKWDVIYNIVPVKIINLETKVIYEDIPLN